MYLLSSIILSLVLVTRSSHQKEEGTLYLPSFYQNGMVFQSGQKVQVFGFSTSDQHQVRVTQTCDGRKEEYRVPGSKFEKRKKYHEDHFVWSVYLSQKPNGQECSFTFKQANNVIEMSVIYGDVWICSGQSNMDFPMEGLVNATEELVASESYNNIHMLKVPVQWSKHGQEDISSVGHWFKPNDRSLLKDFSAVCFLYARYLSDQLKERDGSEKVFGLIQAACPGTKIHVWTSKKAISSCYKDTEQDISILYNAMIRPLHRHNIYGVLWYQGKLTIFFCQQLNFK